MERRLINVKRAAIAAGLALPLMIGGSVARADKPDTDGSGDVEILAQNDRVLVVRDGAVVLHEYEVALPGSEQVEIEGTRVTSGDELGCSYKGTEVEPKRGLRRNQVRVMREVAHDNDNCVLTLESAVVSVSLMNDLGLAAAADAPDLGTAQDKESSEDSALTTTASTTGRYQKLYYEDPPQLDVTSITSRVRWTYTGSCTTWSKHQANWGWLSSTGWSKQESWWGTDRSCKWGATTNSTAKYRNGKFCATVDTYNRYNSNVVIGRSDGSVYYEWNAEKWGGCSNLLSFHRATGTWSG